MKRNATANSAEQELLLREAFFDDITHGRLSLAEATRRMRKVAGKTQKEYAVLLGIAPRVLMDIERGVANPRLDTLVKLARPFGLKVGFIADQGEPMRRGHGQGR